MSNIFTQDRKSTSELRQLLQSGRQIWVRCPSKVIGGMERHWSRARLLNIMHDQAVIKPIKHGGRIERVPLSALRLWKSMNAKQ